MSSGNCLKVECCHYNVENKMAAESREDLVAFLESFSKDKILFWGKNKPS